MSSEDKSRLFPFFLLNLQISTVEIALLFFIPGFRHTYVLIYERQK